MNEDIVTRIFCDVDDFCKALGAYLRSRLLPTDTVKAWFPDSPQRGNHHSLLAVVAAYGLLSSKSDWHWRLCQNPQKCSNFHEMADEK